MLWRARGDSPEALFADPRMRFMPAWMQGFWASRWPGDALDAEAVDFEVDARREDFCVQRVAAMHAASVPLLAGSDTTMPGVSPGSSLHEELALMLEAGLSPLDALCTATHGPAAFMQREDIDRIAPGALADLALLEANPLLDIRNVSRIVGVAIGGAWLDVPALQTALDQAVAATAAPLVAADMARVLSENGLEAALAHYEAKCPAPRTEADCNGSDVAWQVGAVLQQHADAVRMPEFLAWFERTMQSDPDALLWLAEQHADRADTSAAIRLRWQARRVICAAMRRRPAIPPIHLVE